MLIVLSIDGLSAGVLGCYGNDWVGTPAIDALAAESVLLDFALCDTPTVESLRSYWSGTSAIARAIDSNANAAKAAQSLPALSGKSGARSLLVTDDRSILTFAEAAAFEEQVSMNAPLQPQLAAESATTHLAAFFANAAEALQEFAESQAEPGLAWLHTGSLATVWDAPLEYRYRYLEEGDPPPPEFAAPPAQKIAPGEALDPDELLGLRRAYAGQVALLDEMWETFWGFLEKSGLLENAHLLLLSPRGFGLGEHGLIGYPPHEFALHEEYLHVPWLWRLPDSATERHAAEHVQSLVQPADLLPTVLELLRAGEPVENSPAGDGISFAAALQGSNEATRQLALAISPECPETCAIRSAAWHLNHTTQSSATHDDPAPENPAPEDSAPDSRPAEAVEARLYAKPDDRWEMNNVADRCPEIVALLSAYAQRVRSGDSDAQRAPLDEALTALHT